MGQKPARRARQQTKIAVRRETVARLHLEGQTERQIAAELDVSIATISADLKAARQEWQRQYAESYDAACALQLARVERLWFDIYPAIEKGDLRAVEVAIRLLERQAKLLGLDKPNKVEIHDWRAEATEAGLDPQALLDAFERAFDDLTRPQKLSETEENVGANE